MVLNPMRNGQTQMSFVYAFLQREKMYRESTLSKSSPDLRKEEGMILDMLNYMIRDNKIKIFVGIWPFVKNGNR